MSSTPTTTRPTTRPTTGASAVDEASVSESGARESGVPDAGVPEASVPEASVSEASVPEASVQVQVIEALPDWLGVMPWVDAERDHGGHDPRSAYVETFWLPVVGPSTTLLLRRLADEFDGSPQGFEIEAAVLSREIGLGVRTDRRGSFARTLERCAKFNMVQFHGDFLYVRQRVPSLSPRQVTRLNSRLQALHASWNIDPADDGAQRRTELVRATHLARTLLALGESTHDAERQLHQWQFHPSIAWHAIQWAQTDPNQLP